MSRALPIILILSSLAFSAPKPKETALPDYYPAKAGATWTYSIQGAEYITTVSDVKATTKGLLVNISEVGKKGKATPSQKMIVNRDGVFRLEWDGKAIDPPHQILKYPLVAKTTWRYEIPAMIDIPVETLTLTVGQVEEVEVPAGSFKAVRIDVVTSAGASGNFTDWYSTGVGMVQRKTASKVWVLKSFTPGK